MDLTYVPMARGFVYLAAVIDWFSRRVLAWRLSIALEAAFCVEALEEALARHGRPEIFNTDQGSQFTGGDFTGVLTRNGIAISMDGKGAWRDNVFVERLWRSVKYEDSELTTRSPRLAPRSAGISASTTPADRIRALTGRRRIEPTSPGCRRSRRPEPGRCSTYQAGKPVQTNRASSDHPGAYLRRWACAGAHMPRLRRVYARVAFRLTNGPFRSTVEPSNGGHPKNLG